jgi:hypothetical protein
MFKRHGPPRSLATDGIHLAAWPQADGQAGDQILPPSTWAEDHREVNSGRVHDGTPVNVSDHPVKFRTDIWARDHQQSRCEPAAAGHLVLTLADMFRSRCHWYETCWWSICGRYALPVDIGGGHGRRRGMQHCLRLGADTSHAHGQHEKRIRLGITYT